MILDTQTINLDTFHSKHFCHIHIGKGKKSLGRFLTKPYRSTRHKDSAYKK